MPYLKKMFEAVCSLNHYVNEDPIADALGNLRYTLSLYEFKCLGAIADKVQYWKKMKKDRKKMIDFLQNTEKFILALSRKICEDPKTEHVQLTSKTIVNATKYIDWMFENMILELEDMIEKE